jgi:hypothetical protein
MAEFAAKTQQPVSEASSGDQGEQWALVGRVADSTPFKKSPRLRRFFLFITERSLSGHAGEINEYELAWNVFERKESYNPADDSIVRSAARQLRTKVREYFDTEGSGETWIIDIPKGGYVAIFNRRDTPAPQPNLHDERLAGENTGLISDLHRWRIVAGILAGAVVVLLVITLGVSRSRLNATRPLAPTTIVSSVFSNDEPTRVVVGDFGISVLSLITKHPLSLAEYANQVYPPLGGAKPLEQPLRDLWWQLTRGQMTSFAEVAIASAVLRMSGQEGKKAFIQDSRQLTAQDFRSGNIIMIASPLGSPWIYLFEDKLNFRYHRELDQKIPSFLNTHPLPGEKLSYPAAVSAPQYGVSYALLARIPNLSGTGKILLIAGFYTSGVQAAGEFAMDPGSGAQLARLFKVKNVSDLPDFEVLISIDSMASTPLNSKIVTYRRVQ